MLQHAMPPVPQVVVLPRNPPMLGIKYHISNLNSVGSGSTLQTYKDSLPNKLSRRLQ